MNYIDKKYLMLISVYLAGFKNIGNGTYNCRCPLCGDSNTNKRKKRGYFFSKSDTLFYKCHNCGASLNFYSFLQVFNESILKDYRLEKFRAQNNQTSFEEERILEIRSDVPDNILSDCVKISSLLYNHKAKKYIEGRKIPEKMHDFLYYVDDVNKIINKIEKYKDKKFRKMEALIIPFFDNEKEVSYIQMRFFDGEVRYITLEIKGGKKIWGIDKIDWTKPVYVTEGPIDAMFLENGLAVAGASMLAEDKYFQENCQEGCTYIFDADYKTNDGVYKMFKSAVENGFNVVFFDNSFRGKDINDAVLANNWNETELMNYITDHTKSGLSAKLALSRLKPPK